VDRRERRNGRVGDAHLHRKPEHEVLVLQYAGQELAGVRRMRRLFAVVG
jgi:hypothetical protein